MHQMFVDMSILVHAQGEIIDSIELNISEARNYVGKGVTKLAGATTYHETSRKVMNNDCFLLIF